MFFWHGGGILVILTALAGFFASIFLSPVIDSMGLDPAGAGALRLASGAAVACIANWLLCKFLYRNDNESRHTLYFISAKAFTVIFALAVPCAAYIGWARARSSQEDLARYPGLPAFEKADSLINSNSGTTGFGNTGEARLAAEGVSAVCTQLSGMMFSGESKVKGLSKGTFLVYCQRTKDGAAFLIHVPGLRHYKDADAKAALGELTWVNTQAVAKSVLKLPSNAPIAVGLRGISSYGMVWLGRVEGEPVLKDDTSAAKKRFYDWFDASRDSGAGPAAAPQPVPNLTK